mmetsp:Transcript_11865/g.11788  ORF Transcript_11865/g.11788 Transcript_11865/m.11788 type:complete len:126 (-) Transcript_11865:513-890(-)
MVVAYIPFCSLMTIFFFIFALLIAPCNYVIQVYRSFINIVAIKSAKAVGYFFFYLLVAPFMLVIITFTDTAIYAAYSFKANQILFQKTRYKKLDKENVIMLHKITKDYLLRQDSKVQYKVFIKAL